MKIQKGKLGFIGAVIGMIVGGAFFNSCSKKSAQSLPKIGPYDNSNQVASSSLLAHWTFDGTLNETISGTAPITKVGNSFVAGVKGQSLALSNGYLLYPTIAALSSANAIPSVTVSMWVKVDNNGSTGSSFFALTGLTSVQGDWNQGPLNVYAETGHATTTDDTLVLHAAFHSYTGGNYTAAGGDNINDYGVRGTDFQTIHGTNQWVHYVMRYDASGSFLDLFANGVRVSNNNFRYRTTGNPAVGVGAINLNTPTQVLIGGWPNVTTGYTNSAAQTFEGLLTGDIDEIRVYNIALQDSDIGYLYQLELAGR